MSLRKKEFWDNHYGDELRNFDSDGDEGEVWFGKRLSRRISSWLTNKLISDCDHESRILDIGCGNSFLLTTLYCECIAKLHESKLDNIKLFGIDFSQNSIELSKKIVSNHSFKEQIQLMQCDFLNNQQLNQIFNNQKFDFMIDIGTLDAIILISSDENLEQTKLAYMQSIYSLAKTGTIFILASCNHTEEELMLLFDVKAVNKRSYVLIDRIETPKLQYGGKEGSQVNCVIIELRDFINEPV